MNNEFDSNPETSLPLISVVIPAFNEESRISEAIEAVIEQTYPRERTEIIVVDDASMDRTSEIASSHPIRVIRHQVNSGDSASRNTGAEASSGDIIATTDADDVADRDWLSSLSRCYEDSNIGAVVGSTRLIYNQSNWQERVVAELALCLRGSDRVQGIHNKRGGVRRNISAGTNESFRREVFFGVRGFDTGLSSGMDLDILWRIESAGYHVGFAPDAVVYRRQRASVRDYVRQVYCRSIEGAAIYCKHPRKIEPPYLANLAFIPALVLLSLVSLYLDSPLVMTATVLSLVAPIAYFLLKSLKILPRLRNAGDILLLPLLGLLTIAVSSIAGIAGLLIFVLNYEERLMK